MRAIIRVLLRSSGLTIDATLSLALPVNTTLFALADTVRSEVEDRVREPAKRT